MKMNKQYLKVAKNIRSESKESYKHKMAKEVLRHWLELRFLVKEEEDFPGFRPDLAVYDTDGKLLGFYEITNTSEMTGEKIHRIQKWCYLNGYVIQLKEVYADWILKQCEIPKEIISIDYKLF
jgi:hypothetical protein